MFGFLNVNKPAGPTSHDVVARVRRLLPRRVKVGHAGTLDPFADGVLVLCVGPATRLAGYVQQAPKRYLAEITLGATSTTDDTEGEISPTPGAAPPLEVNRVRDVLAGFIGEIQQTPPAHSAVHVGGRRAYKLARKGETIDLPPRTVAIHSIDLLRYEYPLLDIDVRCGCGTYIRSLARDIGAALGVGGYCSKLTRTAVGTFTLEDAVSPDDLDPARDILSPLVALGSLARITVCEENARRITTGSVVEMPSAVRLETQGSETQGFESLGLDASKSPVEVAIVDESGELLAIAALDADARTLHPRKVFQAR